MCLHASEYHSQARQYLRAAPPSIPTQMACGHSPSSLCQQPLRLHSELRRHASLIFGSFALQFFAQRYWSESGLDLFVEQGVASESFESYVLRYESYVLESTVKSTEFDGQSMYHMYGNN